MKNLDSHLNLLNTLLSLNIRILQYQHIQSQIRYVLNKYFSAKDLVLITEGQISVHDIEENTLLVDLVTAGFEVYQIECLHQNLQIDMEDFADIAGVELLVIDEDTKLRDFKDTINANEAYYHLFQHKM